MPISMNCIKFKHKKWSKGKKETPAKLIVPLERK